MLEEPLDALDPSCYDKGDDVIDNIDEFIHVGRCKWDVIGHDGDPIFNIEDHFQLFLLQQPYVIAIDSDVWQQEDDMITDLFQPPKDELMKYSHNDF
jgi:ABC-type transporter Mla maintaining outer membrane lipid asymmetry ATPase subunit MlaF